MNGWVTGQPCPALTPVTRGISAGAPIATRSRGPWLEMAKSSQTMSGALTEYQKDVQTARESEKERDGMGA